MPAAALWRLQKASRNYHRDSLALAWSLVILLSCIADASVRPDQVVGKVHGRNEIFTSRYGTAWCLSSRCDVLVTNQHVVLSIGKKLQVNGVAVKKVFLASGPEDEGAQLFPGFVENYRLAPVRDLALLLMKRPLAARGMQRVALYGGDLQSGEAVQLISFNGGKLSVDEGRFDSMVRHGILKFVGGDDLGPGISGGLVLNREEKAIGVVFGIAPDRRSCYAVPIWSLADFISKTDAALYADLFKVQPSRPSLRPMSEKSSRLIDEIDLDLLFGSELKPVLPESYLVESFTSWPVVDQDADPALQTRPSECSEVVALRVKAQELHAGMKNFMAVQRLVLADGAIWEHQLRVLDGIQKFQTNDGRVLDDLPLPAWGPVPGAEWQSLPQMVGTNLRLPVRYVGQRKIAGRPVHIFEYRASEEDAVCSIRIKAGVRRRVWKGPVACRGSVWTDEEFNLLRISQEQNVPARTHMDRYQVVILYGRLERTPIGARLVPVSMRLVARTTGGTVFTTWGRFSDYQVFAATAKITYGEVLP